MLLLLLMVLLLMVMVIRARARAKAGRTLMIRYCIVLIGMPIRSSSIHYPTPRQFASLFVDAVDQTARLHTQVSDSDSDHLAVTTDLYLVR